MAQVLYVHRVVHVFVEQVETCDIVDDHDEDQHDFEFDEELVQLLDVSLDSDNDEFEVLDSRNQVQQELEVPVEIVDNKTTSEDDHTATKSATNKRVHEEGTRKEEFEGNYFEEYATLLGYNDVLAGKKSKKHHFMLTTIVVDSESNETCGWFLYHLKKDLKLQNGSNLTIVLDQHKCLKLKIDTNPMTELRELKTRLQRA
ncbi:hypothetical protein SLEP1_g6988 [Rubroshorea leprosula]|uniref:Transposase n=1 Tax=Rubroshorea leprosula TaxID=152421 RepID=A0AAV5HXB2_9ROSI|nr:hypothetical protein SLEP1_g6988 [Rubroshorea leprosula]